MKNTQLHVDCSNAVKITNLRKDFSGFSLKDISFSLPTGSIMGFIGENGAGKTTTIKLILNQMKKNSGTVEVFGMDHLTYEKQIKEEVGVVLDQGFFYEGLTPLQAAAILRRLYKNWDQTLFLDYLHRLQVPAKQCIKEFSKGMRMKLSIICALAHHPRLLLLDEPTSGLDPVVRKDILDLFQEFIQDEDHSILISSHITDDLEKISDYITFIHDGEIVFSEPTDDITGRYGIIKCGQERFAALPKDSYVSASKTAFGISALTDDRCTLQKACPDLILEPASLEDIMIFYHARKE